MISFIDVYILYAYGAYGSRRRRNVGKCGKEKKIATSIPRPR